MRSFFVPISAILTGLAAATPCESQSPAPIVLTYADLADLAVGAPIVAHVRIASTAVVKGEQAATLPPGLTRFYVEADLLSLMKSGQSLPARINYVVDLPRDARGRTPLRKNGEFILFAAPVSGRPGSLQLVAPDAQLPWTAAEADRLRLLLAEATSANAPPRIAGIGRAFHVPGALPGESETQIFLRAADGRPVSLSVLRRPGQTPLWAVALSEIVDEAAGPPRRDTLLWYRLACTLPRALPRQSVAEDDDHKTAIGADYQLVLDALGPCVRNRPKR
jgi:hypothetical protein